MDTNAKVCIHFLSGFGGGFYVVWLSQTCVGPKHTRIRVLPQVLEAALGTDLLKLDRPMVGASDSPFEVSITRGGTVHHHEFLQLATRISTQPLTHSICTSVASKTHAVNGLQRYSVNPFCGVQYFVRSFLA